MDIRVFKTFIQVAESRHFGRAAENLYITQAAVSARIKQLEEFYDSQLFIRDKNNLRLTPTGETLLSHARLLVEQMEQSKLALAVAKAQKVNFNIAATPNVWDAFFSNRILEVLELHDELAVGTEISVREAIQRKLDNRTLDVGLLTDPIKDDDFDNQLIAHFELALVGTQPTFNEGCDNYIWVDWGITFQKEHALHHKIQPSFRTSTAMIALEVMRTKSGFAYLPESLVQPFVDEGELFIIETAVQIKRPVYLVSRKNADNPRLLNEVKQLLSRLP